MSRKSLFSSRSGEVLTTLAIASLVIVALGVILGGRSITQTKRSSSFAQQPTSSVCDYGSYSQVRYKGQILTGISGFGYHRTFPFITGTPIASLSGEFKIVNPQDKAEVVWTSADISTNTAKNQTAVIQLTSQEGTKAKDYQVVGTFCYDLDPSGKISGDPLTCSSFCKDKQSQYPSTKISSCEYGWEKAVAAIDGIRVGCGGRVQYGWNVLLKGEITPSPTASPTPTKSKIQPTEPKTESQPTLGVVNCPSNQGIIKGKITPSGSDPDCTSEVGCQVKLSLCGLNAAGNIDCGINTNYGFAFTGEAKNWNYQINYTIPANKKMGLVLWSSLYDKNNTWLKSYAIKSEAVSCTGVGKKAGYYPQDCILDLLEMVSSCTVEQDYKFNYGTPFVTIAPIKTPTPVLSQSVLPSSVLVSPTSTIDPSSTLPPPTRIPTPTSRPTSTPIPPTSTPIPTVTTGPISCNILSTGHLHLNTLIGERDFTEIKDFNRQWHMLTNQPNSQPVYFKNGHYGLNNDGSRISYNRTYVPGTDREICVKLNYDQEYYKINRAFMNSNNSQKATSRTIDSDNNGESETLCIPFDCTLTDFDYGFVVEQKMVSRPLKVAVVSDQGLDGQNSPGLTSPLADPSEVWKLVRSVSPDLILNGGDFDRVGDSEGWYRMITNGIANLPILLEAGNHETFENYWLRYQPKVIELVKKNSNAYCDYSDESQIGLNYSCTFKGITTVFVNNNEGNPQAWSDDRRATYITNIFSETRSPWKICIWHRPNTEIQLGTKSYNSGWLSYEACRRAGAIIINSDEHMYSRTKTISDFVNLTADPACNQTDNVCVSPGKTISIVNALGGTHEHRSQWRCRLNDESTDKNGLGTINCNGKDGRQIWAKSYANNIKTYKDKQGSNWGERNSINYSDNIVSHTKSGALFFTFNDGASNRASATFKTVDGTEIDRFTINAGDISTKPMSSPAVSPSISNRQSIPSQNFFVKLNISNPSKLSISKVEIKVCRRGNPNDCTTITKTVDLSKDTVSLIENLLQINGTPILQNDKLDLSCTMFFSSGQTADCSSRSLSGDNGAIFDVDVMSNGQVVSDAKTQRELCDIRPPRDLITNGLDFAYMVSNYLTPAADVNGDGTTNAGDLSACYRWIDEVED